MHIALVAAGILTVVGLSYINHGSVAGEAVGPVRVGAMLCLTGSCAEWGENSRKGIELAIAEINTRGGVDGRQVELIVEDSQEDETKNVLAAYRSLRLRGAEYVIGPTWSHAGNALAPVAGKDEALVVSPSLGVADFNEYAENLFNTWPHDDAATQYLARYLFNSGVKRVALVSTLDPWGKAQGEIFTDTFTSLGGELTFTVEAAIDQRDFRTESIRVIQSNPELVMFVNYQSIGTVAKELKELGYRGQKASILMDDTRIAAADGGLDGALFVQSPKAGEEFTNAFVSQYGAAPGISADTAYDSVHLIASGIERAGTSDVRAVVTTLNGIERLEGGAFGELVFDGKRGVVREPELWVVQGSEMKKYE